MANTKSSVLEMIDFYFSKFSFDHEKVSKQIYKKYNTNITINYAENEEDKNLIRVTIDTNISNEEENLKLYIQAVGFFKLNSEDMTEEISEQILKRNTVAIMFPFIRSQVSLLTTQPGLMPVMIQPIDFNSIE